MPIGTWPSPSVVVDEFYRLHLAVPLDLWKAFRVTTRGSGRRAGPRRLQWAATLVLAVASLEAGLEDILLAAHGHRAGKIGQSLTRDDRRYLVEDPLQVPNARKIKQTLFGAFGIELAALPSIATFTTRRKVSPNRGSGKGDEVPGPTTWSGLAAYLDALMHIRNATAHGDVVKIRTAPRSAEGDLWVMRQDGAWSIQQPHALTGLRTAVATFNAVAAALDAELGLFVGQQPLRRADDVFDY
jgi:hypothetical protein